MKYQKINEAAKVFRCLNIEQKEDLIVYTLMFKPDEVLRESYSGKESIIKYGENIKYYYFRRCIDLETREEVIAETMEITFDIERDISDSDQLIFIKKVINDIENQYFFKKECLKLLLDHYEIYLKKHDDDFREYLGYAGEILFIYQMSKSKWKIALKSWHKNEQTKIDFNFKSQPFENEVVTADIEIKSNYKRMGNYEFHLKYDQLRDRFKKNLPFLGVVSVKFKENGVLLSKVLWEIIDHAGEIDPLINSKMNKIRRLERNASVVDLWKLDALNSEIRIFKLDENTFNLKIEDDRFKELNFKYDFGNEKFITIYDFENYVKESKE